MSSTCQGLSPTPGLPSAQLVAFPGACRRGQAAWPEWDTPNGNTKERRCHSDYLLKAQTMPHPLCWLQILDTHLPTGNSQYLHEGLDAHSLVISNQFGERGVSPVFPQDDIACIGLHLDHVVSAAAFASGEMDKQK